MKRKLLTLLAILAASCCFAFGFSACDTLPNETSSLKETSIEESSSETSIETHTHTYLKILNTNALKSEATCTTPKIYYVSCPCGELGTETFKYGKALGHTEEILQAVAPTCTKTGLTAGKHCGVCSETLVVQEEVKANGHTEVIDKAVAPTCTETGLTEGKHCEVCSETLVEQEEVKANGHTYENGFCLICGKEQGLKYALSSDENYYILIGIGTCKDTEIIIPSTYNNLPVTSIGESAFEYCTSLTSVTIPNSVTSIGNSAFADCVSLASVIIPNSVTSIGWSAFDDCESLTSITLPDSVTFIDSTVFSDCSSLTSITIPNSVISIGHYAFSGCSSLTSITIPNSVTSIGHNPFYGCSSLTSIEVYEQNENYKSIDGNLYTKNGKTLIRYAIGKTVTSFTIPDSVTSIGNSAFEGCESLTNVVIGNSVTSIGFGAFSGCYNLTSVEIGNSVTSIEIFAFNVCSSLTTVYYNGTAEEWNAIQENIGLNNSYLTNATIYYYIENEADVPTDGGNYWHYVNGVPTAW